MDVGHERTALGNGPSRQDAVARTSEARPYPTCKHRDWTDEDNETDATFPSGDECGAQASFLACTPSVDTPVCCDHKCRCTKPIQQRTNEALGERAKLAHLVREGILTECIEALARGGVHPSGVLCTPRELIEKLREPHAREVPVIPRPDNSRIDSLDKVRLDIEKAAQGYDDFAERYPHAQAAYEQRADALRRFGQVWLAPQLLRQGDLTKDGNG